MSVIVARLTGLGLLIGMLLGQSHAAIPSIPWSFAPVATVSIPAPSDGDWSKTAIDRLVLWKLEAERLRPNPDATRYELIRRASFDLTGLPPTEDQIVAFVGDPQPTDKAFAAVVDGLLKSPRFGERWARHWLDVARYADSVGNIWNAPFLYAGRYRNYVIEAYNSDKPFDRFIQEQLAGDLLPATTVAERRANLTATGFLALGSVDLTEGGAEQAILDRVDDQIDVTSRAFLGLTVSCARCHDHKYDPVSQKNYYAMAGIFYSARTWPGQAYRARGTHQYVDLSALLRLPTRAAEIRAAPIPKSSRGSASSKAAPGSMSMGMQRQSTMYANDGQRTFVFTPDPNLAIGVTDGALRNCAFRINGEPYNVGPEMRRGAFVVPGLPALPPAIRSSSGRLELAEWIASPANPLTARVYVNRVWQHLFGEGLVRTVDDFGTNSTKPVHPELLDHLAGEFVRGGWSTKKLIRSIMLSRVYQLSSRGNPVNEMKDAENKFLWRMNLRRLELEPIRDSMLAVGGTLQTGPPPGFQIAGSGGKGKYGRTRALLGVEAPYRTIYLPVLRTLLPEIYGVFDFPDPAQIMGKRDVTTVATQSLFLMNSVFVQRASHAAADRLLRDKSLNETGRIRLAYLRILTRQPDDSEIALAGSFMRGLKPPSNERNPELYRWAAFVQSLMASGEFRYVL